MNQKLVSVNEKSRKLLTDIVEECAIFKNSDGAMLGNKKFDSTVKKVLPVSSADCDR